MLNLNDCFKKTEEKWVSRSILDEVVIMPLCRSEDDMQYIYSIANETGFRIWQLLDATHTVRDIQEILKREFQGQAEVIEREVLVFLKDILSAKLIEKSTPLRTKAALNYKPIHKKKPYKTPEIAKIKMQPEQAVLSCCTSGEWLKTNTRSNNTCMSNLNCASANCVLVGSGNTISSSAGTT